MKSAIHPTAIIEDGATLGADVQIGPYCIVGANVVLGDGVVLHAHVVVDGITTIGAGTEIYPFAAIGTAPQDLKYNGEKTVLRIGVRNRIREHVTMNPGTETGGGETIVGDNNLFMVGAHIAHDCIVGSNNIFANNATLGGHVVVGDRVLIGGLAAVHQFVRIGSGAVVGGMSGVESDVVPYGRVKGERASLAGLNFVGLERNGVTKDGIKTLQRALNELFADGGTMEQRLDRVEKDYAGNDLVMTMAAFARAKSRFPLCQPSRKSN